MNISATNKSISLQFHNYVTRISPHLLKYPRYTDRPNSSHSQTQAAMTSTMRPNAPTTEDTTNTPHPLTNNELTPMDCAMRDLIAKLRPYGLTKAEVLTIINLGIGLSAGESEDQTGEANGEGVMDLDEDPAVNGEGEDGEEGEEGEGDFGALALFDAVIEEREYRISNEDFVAILGIIRETLAEDYRG